MKKNLIWVLLILSFIISPVFAEQKYKVIKIIDGDTIYVDFNNNGIPEQDEKVRLNGIDTFEVHSRSEGDGNGEFSAPQLNVSDVRVFEGNEKNSTGAEHLSKLQWQMKLNGFTQDEALGLGYYGKEFAKKQLLN